MTHSRIRITISDRHFKHLLGIYYENAPKKMQFASPIKILILEGAQGHLWSDTLCPDVGVCVCLCVYFSFESKAINKRDENRVMSNVVKLQHNLHVCVSAWQSLTPPVQEKRELGQSLPKSKPS